MHNTLKCHLYVLLETFHNADDLGNRVWKLLRPDQTYNIPLHLTNQSRMVLRPWVAGLVQAELHALSSDDFAEGPADYNGAHSFHPSNPNPDPNPNPNPNPNPKP